MNWWHISEGSPPPLPPSCLLPLPAVLTTQRQEAKGYIIPQHENGGRHKENPLCLSIYRLKIKGSNWYLLLNIEKHCPLVNHGPKNVRVDQKYCPFFSYLERVQVP